jgi:acetyl esterase/lipase
MLAAGTSVPVPPGATEHVYKRIAGTDLCLYVFHPPGGEVTERRPAAVYFPGGGWTTLRLDGGFRVASLLASLGVVGVSVTYRVHSVHDSTPYDSVADAKSALRWLREHATELGIDPSRITGVGDSAGAHVLLTAALLETFDEPGENRGVSSKPDALFLSAAVVTTVADDPSCLTPDQRSFMEWLGPRAREISPVHHLARNLPPTVIFHGKQDPLMPYAAVEMFCRRARALGNQCDLVGFDDAAHDVTGAKPVEFEAGLVTLLEGLGYLR